MFDHPSLTPNIAIAPSSASITPTKGLPDLWLHGKSLHMQRYYRHEALKVVKVVNRPSKSITLADVQGYATAHCRLNLALLELIQAT